MQALNTSVFLSVQNVKSLHYMLTYVEIFIITLILLMLFMYIYNAYFSEVEYFQSEIDNRKYLVRSLPDKETAANMLAEINRDLMALIKHMKDKYPDNVDVNRMYDNYNPNAISEGSPDSGYTSYSVNKGEKLVICIRNSDNSFVDKNVVMYPALHELGHIMTSEIGHTKMFWDNFKFILKEAIEIGIYKKIDFQENPTPYCGITIKSSVI
jgi:hypothetical protein